eukprot:TRINITY_DN8334_c0_g2_i1.p1 TRINITY_DN8334_c0_g2~~TRINITY_DN8334_c0_g2_i1.p1  ORF type:complete len:1836 (+),score=406.87 TRINITY_DN8334_c0_g2_i1:160-5667(+)
MSTGLMKQQARACDPLQQPPPAFREEGSFGEQSSVARWRSKRSSAVADSLSWWRLLRCIVPWAITVVFHWPTAISAVCCVWLQLRFLDGLAFDILLRLSRTVALVLHESAHVLAAAALLLGLPPPSRDGPAAKQAWLQKREGFWQGLYIRMHNPEYKWSLLYQFVPFMPMPAACVSLQAASLSKSGDAVVRLAGLVASVLLAWALRPSDNAELIELAIFFGHFVVAAGAFLSDIPWSPLLGALPPMGCYCCGNWGMLVPRAYLTSAREAQWTSEAFPETCAKLLGSVLDIVELRGAQAGGCNFFLEAGGKVDSCRSRVVKSKRGHLATMLFKKIRKEMTWKLWRSLLACKRLRPLPVVLAQGHSRFGTSSRPAEEETHPHQWLGAHKEIVWIRDLETRAWTKKPPAQSWVTTTITHNGDFDGWEFFGRSVPNGQLGELLSRLLHFRNPAAGDSPKLAGMLDLLLCKGMWIASVRLAFVEVVMQHIEEASGWQPLERDAPNEVPKPAVFASWAAIFDEAFEQTVKENPHFTPGKFSAGALAGDVQDRFAQGAAQIPRQAVDELQKWSMENEVLELWIKAACSNFFQLDLLSATCKFFKHAEGTFGVTVTNSLSPTSIVLCAKGQPMSIAMDGERPCAYWASEPASLNCSWPSKDHVGVVIRAAALRYDLHDATGEAVELRMVNGGVPLENCETLAALELPGTRYSNVEYFAMPDTHKAANEFHILVRGTGLPSAVEQLRQTMEGKVGGPVPMTVEKFTARCVNLLSLPAPAPKRLKNEKGMDPVAYDIKDIPLVIADIEASWDDKSSLNWKSGRRLAECIKFLVQSRAKYNKNDFGVDVLVYGIENSLWLGQQFIADFKRIFPTLNVTAMSSNWVLGMNQELHGHVEPLNFALCAEHLTLSKHAVCLAISQSGTTYPTVWATRLLSRHATPLHLFAMSGDFDTVLAASLGQDLARPDFGGANFSNMAGIRPCEPSTVATIAMHHTLSHLLVHIAAHVGQDPSLRVLLKSSELKDFQDVLRGFFPTAEGMCGMSQHGYKLKSELRNQLLATGDYLASHLLEGWYALLVGAIYVYLTVTFGMPIASFPWSHLETFVEDDLEEDGPLPKLYPIVQKVAAYVVAHVDAHIYVFLAAILASFHRWWTGRRLWTRFCNRTIVICESTVNYKLLRSYLSKLRALSFRFTTFGVAGQNPLDHFVHEMTHLTTSEVIVCMGRPDGRLGTLAAQEAAIIMSAQQSRFVASTPYIGIEALSVGHNPWQKDGLWSRAITIPTDRRPTFLSSNLMKTHKDGHAPAEVVSMCAALAEGRTEAAASSQSGPAIQMSDLKKRMGAKEVSPAVAKKLVLSLLQEQQEQLGIEASKFNIEDLMPAARERVPSGEAPPSPTASKSFFSKFRSKKLKCEKCSKVLPSDAKFCLECGAKVATPEEAAALLLRQAAEASTDLPGMVPLVNGGGDTSPPSGSAETKRSKSMSLTWGQTITFASTERKTLTPANMMALLRGHKMQKQVRALQAAKTEADLKKRIREADARSAVLMPVRRYFEMWVNSKDYSKRMRKGQGRKEKNIKEVHEVIEGKRSDVGSEGEINEVSRAPWRVREECRRKGRARLFGRGAAITWGVRLGTCFVKWAQVVRERKDALMGGTPVQENVDGVGHALAKSCKTQADLVKGLRLVEALYETRVASAERLLAFMIIYHRAVRPLSTLPFLSFDMDRTESRLRVASTPAPVPFCEHLPEMPAFHKAVTTLQRRFRELSASRESRFSRGKLSRSNSMIKESQSQGTRTPDSRSDSLGGHSEDYSSALRSAASIQVQTEEILSAPQLARVAGRNSGAGVGLPPLDQQ